MSRANGRGMVKVSNKCPRCGGQMLGPDWQGDLSCLQCGCVVYPHKAWEPSQVAHFTNASNALQHEYTRFHKEMEVREKLFAGIRTWRLRKSYRDDILRIRHLAGMPPEGYWRREATKKLLPYAQAFLDCMDRKRGSYKRRGEAGIWAALTAFVGKFAKEHPLSKHQPMPIEIAFDEIVYKKHRTPKFILKGHYFDNQETTVVFDDGLTPAPQGIARMVKSRVKRHHVPKGYEIRIFKREDHWWRWEIERGRIGPVHT